MGSANPPVDLLLYCSLFVACYLLLVICWTRIFISDLVVHLTSDVEFLMSGVVQSCIVQPYDA